MLFNFIRYYYQRWFKSPALDTDQYLIPELAHITYVFGSRAYPGVAKVSSDVDLAVTYSNLPQIITYLKSAGISYKVKRDVYSTSDEGLEFTLNGLLYQVSAMSDNIFNITRVVTSVLSTLDTHHIFDKPTRRIYHEKLTAALLTRYFGSLPKALLDHIQSSYPELFI